MPKIFRIFFFVTVAGIVLGFVQMPPGLCQQASEGIDQTDSVSPDLQPRYKAWRDMKSSNPEEFERMIAHRKEMIQNRMQRLRSESPERYREFRRRDTESRRGRLERLRNRNPEGYRRAMERKYQKFRSWQSAHPDRYQKFAERNPGFSRKVSHYAQRDIRPMSSPGAPFPRGLNGQSQGSAESSRGTIQQRTADAGPRMNRGRHENTIDGGGNRRASDGPRKRPGPQQRRPQIERKGNIGRR